LHLASATHVNKKIGEQVRRSVRGSRLQIHSNMLSPKPHRKLWVCEPGLTATSVPVQFGELVDDVKTLVLSRYANSLGKAVDAANMTITIMPRLRGPPACYERSLSPDEDIFQLLDCYYPGGQRLVEALIISTSLRTKRNSSLGDSHKRKGVPVRASTEPLLFDASVEPATPVRGGLTIREIQATPQQGSSRKQLQSSHLVRSVSTGNQNATLRADSAKFECNARELFDRSTRDLFDTGRKSPQPPATRRDSSPSEDASSRRPLHRRNLTAQSTPFRPSPEDRTTSSYFPPAIGRGSRDSSHSRQSSQSRPDSRPKTHATTERPPKPKAQPRFPRPRALIQLDGAIPPINVLIAEDNSLVSRVVSKQMQQLNVRWDTAANGLEAVNKWKAGKFHLIFMDIGMPVMDGLEATKEIRRIERGENEDSSSGKKQQRGPVIIVALTASSLPADRDGALNAGCNDFITKPLEQVWLAQKVKEWGCMQALIDYEEWRIWKGYQIRESSGEGPLLCTSN
jgi:osomolarity two-component system response regulator SSK1